MLLKIAAIAVLSSVLTSCDPAPKAKEKPSVIRLDYATYNLASLVIKEKGWAEEAFAAEGIAVEWTQSLGSHRALSFLQGGNLDFGSTAGASSLVSLANGNPIRVVYLFSRPEWTALVVPNGSAISRIEDLRGRKVAAPLGTDPHIFLLRALASVGLSEKDVELVPLNHGEGAAALATGQVDAWAGLDPHMARLQLEAGAQLFYRNIEFVSYGALNVREEFAEAHPAHVAKVVELYERARVWILNNREEAVALQSTVAQVTPEVARLQLTDRTHFPDPVPGETFKSTTFEAGRVLQAGGHIKPEVDLAALVDSLVDPSWATALPRNQVRR